MKICAIFAHPPSFSLIIIGGAMDFTHLQTYKCCDNSLKVLKKWPFCVISNELTFWNFAKATKQINVVRRVQCTHPTFSFHFFCLCGDVKVVSPSVRDATKKKKITSKWEMVCIEIAWLNNDNYSNRVKNWVSATLSISNK